MNDDGPSLIIGYLVERAQHDAATLPLQVFLIAAAILFSLWVNRRRKRLMPPPWRQRGTRVFAETLRDWPVVLKQGPGQYSIHAPHWPPVQSARDDGREAIILTVLFGVAVVAFWQGSMSASLIMAGAGIWIMRHWPPARPRPADITLDGNYTRWASPDGRTYEVPTMTFKMQVLLPHRLAQATAWYQQQAAQQQAAQSQSMAQMLALLTQRLQPQTGGPTRAAAFGMVGAALTPPSMSAPTYQIASELLAHTGPEDREWMAMAEFGDDERGQRAHALLAAIRFVRDKSLEELGVTTARQEARDQSGPRRQPKKFE